MADKVKDDSMGQTSEDSTSKEKSKCAGCTWPKVQAFLLKWHLPIFLVVALLFGYLVPTPGRILNEADLGGICFQENCVWNTVGNLCVTLIFFISGIRLKTDEIKEALRACKGTFFGVVSILFITPCVSFGIIVIPFAIQEFALGLALFYSMPTTLSSGPIITGQAKGNIAVALFLTVVTNIVGVFTMPLFVSSFLTLYEVQETNATSDSVDINLDPIPIIVKLIFIILIPLGVGKAFRYFKAVRDFAKRFKTQLKLASSFLLAMVPWMLVSSNANDFRKIDIGSFFAMFGMGALVHLVYLVFNFVVSSYILVLVESEKRAGAWQMNLIASLRQFIVVIVASQKTLPVAITVLELLPQAIVGSPGLAAIPIICAHFVQIVIDAFLAAYWAAKPLDNSEGISEKAFTEKHSSKKHVEGWRREERDHAPGQVERA